jgi:hypothetical protein
MRDGQHDDAKERPEKPHPDRDRPMPVCGKAGMDWTGLDVRTDGSHLVRGGMATQQVNDAGGNGPCDMTHVT